MRSSSTVRPDELADWTHDAGGRVEWVAWIHRQAFRCYQRGRKWHRLRGTVDEAPSERTWLERIVRAVNDSNGVAYFSKLPLSLAPPHKNTDALWPSVDHTEHPGVADVVIETRIVNDMKTIFSEDEFRRMIGHLTATLCIEPARLPPEWKPQRDFAGPQGVEEPPLPSDV